MKSRKVIWTEKARDSLREHHDHIKKDSVTAAKKVTSEIINASKELNIYADKYQLDEYYPNNPGNIRRFFKWSYRIVYQVSPNTVEILNVLHTSQEPHTRA